MRIAAPRSGTADQLGKSQDSYETALSKADITSQRPDRFERDVSEVGKEHVKALPVLEHQAVDITK